MAKPPPVPPKDPLYPTLTTADAHGLTPPSTSKRKRVMEANADDDYGNGNLTNADPDTHTPKRKRGSQARNASTHGTDVSAESTPADKRNIRRKKGFRNLSNLSLRHAAQKQSPKQTQARESKFQEGSLTDKPSQEPPSVFTRVTRTNSGNLLEVEELMEDYHQVAGAIQGTAAGGSTAGSAYQSNAAALHQQGTKGENGGFFRFGRQFALNFHPVVLWNKMWNESKEELIRQNMEEAERKARLKAEAEEQYARMKKDGLFKPQPLSTLAANARPAVKELSTPLDSSFAIGENSATLDNIHSASATSQGFESGSRSESEVPESASRPNKGFPSRLHFKKPSLSDIKGGLKRFSSDLNLSALVAAGRESSSSLSPVKTDFDDSTLRRSQSRFDLKKQQKLSKRVSDLEVKLQQARKELDEALIEASPMPKLNHKYEQFKPSWTVKRPTFTPGKLPSLPSERILMAEEEAKFLGSENMTRLDSPGDEHMNEDEVETIKARDHQLKPRLDSLFTTDENNLVQPSSALGKTQNNKEYSQQQIHDIDTMDPNSIMDATQTNNNPVTQKQGDYASLDAKLKALDKNAKLAKRSARSKKRKSGVADEDKAYKPNEVDHTEDDELAENTPRKKRKSTGTKKTGNSANTQSPNDPIDENNTPNNKKGELGTSAANNNSSHVGEEGDIDPILQGDGDDTTSSTGMKGATTLEDPKQRDSLDSQGQPLEPLMEEDEENVAITESTTKVPLKDAPSRPTAKATPARHSRSLRPRSLSPNKERRSVGTELIGKRKATSEAGDHSNNLRSKKSGLEGVEGVDGDDIVIATPGVNGVPKLPKGANGSFESLLDSEKATAEVEIITSGQQKTANGQYEWPDDVF